MATTKGEKGEGDLENRQTTRLQNGRRAARGRAGLRRGYGTCCLLPLAALLLRLRCNNGSRRMQSGQVPHRACTGKGTDEIHRTYKTTWKRKGTWRGVSLVGVTDPGLQQETMGTQPKARKKESHKTELARVAVAPFAVRRTVGIQAGCLTQRARARGGWCFSRAEVVFCSLLV